jgi:hypothetical protein
VNKIKSYIPLVFHLLHFGNFYCLRVAWCRNQMNLDRQDGFCITLPQSLLESDGQNISRTTGLTNANDSNAYLVDYFYLDAECFVPYAPGYILPETHFTFDYRYFIYFPNFVNGRIVEVHDMWSAAYYKTLLVYTRCGVNFPGNVDSAYARAWFHHNNPPDWSFLLAEEGIPDTRRRNFHLDPYGLLAQGTFESLHGELLFPPPEGYRQALQNLAPDADPVLSTIYFQYLVGLQPPISAGDSDTEDI